MRNHFALVVHMLYRGSRLSHTPAEDASQSPPMRPEAPVEHDPAGSTLGPIDLVYVCGNKFLATNGYLSQVQVTYRVAGTVETGGLTLRTGPGGDPGSARPRWRRGAPGTVELYRDDVSWWRGAPNEGLSCGAPAMLGLSAAAMGTEATVGEVDGAVLLADHGGPRASCCRTGRC